MCRILISIILLLSSYWVCSQSPNNAYKLPFKSDMPNFAKKIYQEDVNFNVYELDEEFKPWKEKYLALRAEIQNIKNPTTEQLKELADIKGYYKYYGRWRYGVEKYIQPNGYLDFSKEPAQPRVTRSTSSNRMSSTWEFLGPKNTYWARNDNSAIPLPLSPWQANIYSFDVAPSNHSVLYAGTETGAINKTIDKGLNWTSVGADNVNLKSGVGAIAIHPTNTNIVYVGNAIGVHRSGDGGTTWTHDFNPGFAFNTNDIKIKANEPEVMLAAGSSLKRRIAGPAWSTIISRETYDIAFHPTNPDIVYALIKNAAGDACQFFKSTDAGFTFTEKPSGWNTGAGNGGGRMTVTSIAPNTIYCIVLNATVPKVLKSIDAGETWTVVATGNTAALPINDNGQGYYDLAISASQTDANQLILGILTSYKSIDGGVTYTPVGGYAGPFNTHPDMQEMITIGSDSWIATDGGLNYSTDFWTSTTNFEPRLNNLRGTQMWGFDSGWNEDVMIGGKYHNGNTAYFEGFPAGDFLRMGGAEQATGYVNPGNNRMTYFSDLGGRILPSVIDQPFTSFNISKWPNENYINMEYSGQFWDPTNYNTYFIGKDNKVWKTKNNGTSFDELFSHSNSGATVQHIAISRTNSAVMYCTVQNNPNNTGELWKTTNAGSSWIQCTNPVGPSNFERRVSEVVVSGIDENTIWWCFKGGNNGQKVYKSNDGGVSWTNLTTATLDNVEIADMEHQLGTNGGIYLNGSQGLIYYRNNTMPDWVLYNTGIPSHLTSEMTRIKPFYKTGKLRNASTNGIWEVDFYEPSTTTLVQPMADKRMVSCSRDTIQLESYSVTRGSATYTWAISPAPSYISSTSVRNPKVVLGVTPGEYSVSLTIVDANGTISRNMTNFFSNLPEGNLCQIDTIPGFALTLNAAGEYAQQIKGIGITTNHITLSCWIKPDGSQAVNSGIIFSGNGGATGMSYYGSGRLGYTWRDEPGTYNYNSNLYIPINEWSHVALVVEPTQARLYLNGIEATHALYTHIPVAFTGAFQFGIDRSNTSRNFKGQMDEACIYNRALTKNEIRELMHLTKNNPHVGNLPQSDPSLIAYYQFNEGLGTLTHDRVGTAHANLAGSSNITAKSTGPFGGGSFDRQLVDIDGLIDFPNAKVKLAFNEASTTFPNGDVIMTRINLAPDSIPNCKTYVGGNHYWIMQNFGTETTFDALDSIIFESINVPAASQLTHTSYTLNSRSPRDHFLPWATNPGNSIRAVSGTNGSITFGSITNITQARQFLPTNFETIVKNSADSGNGTLRQILGCVTDGATITYDQPTTTTTLLTQPLTIDKSVTLLGLNALNKPVITIDFTTISGPVGINILGTNKSITFKDVEFRGLNNVLNKPILQSDGSTNTLTIQGEVNVRKL